MPGLIRAAIEYTFKRAKPVDPASPASATGYQGAAIALGYQGRAMAGETGAIVLAVSQNIREIFGWESAFFLPGENGLEARDKSPGLAIDADDTAVATWAFQNGADFICVGMFDFQVVADVNVAIDTLAKLKDRKRDWFA